VDTLLKLAELLPRLREGYVKERRVLQLTSRTDDGREPLSGRPLTWQFDFGEGTASSGDVKWVRDSPIVVTDDGLKAQLLLWTLWGGSHSITIGGIEMTARLRVSEIR
jgi:hypothetical protein